MVGANSIFFLMVGAALLTYLTMYLFAHNQKLDLKQKNATLNAALSTLQEERAKLIVKSDGVFMENTAQQAEIAHLNDEIRELRASLMRLESDNQQVTKEYKSLESFVFESDSSSGIDAFQKIMGRYLAK
jgi:predicted nuclease with TOPRIM domain